MNKDVGFYCVVSKIEKENVIDLISATTPVRKETGHLKLIAAWKFIAALSTRYFDPYDMSAIKYEVVGEFVDEIVPEHFKKFEEAIQKFLPDIINGKFQIDEYVQKIS